MASDTYEFLQELLKTGEVNRWNYPEYVRDVVVSRNPGSTKIIIAFENDDDFLDTLGIDSDDDKYVWSKFSHNYEPDRYDLERYNDDWSEGYIFDGLDDENKEKINYILKIIDPTLSLENDPNYRGGSKIANVLLNKFPTEVDEITYEFGYQNQLCIGRAVKRELLYETKNPYLRFGIVEKDWGWRFETTVSILLNWYRTLKAEDEDLKGLLTKLIERYQPNMNRGDWYELEYSVWCEDYDKDEFNYQAGRILDRLVEDLIESSTGNESFNEYLKILDVVSDLGGFNKWIRLPDVNRSINFQSIDPETNRLVFWLTKPGHHFKDVEERSIKTVEDLYTTMHNPELFEQIKRLTRKIIKEQQLSTKSKIVNDFIKKNPDIISDKPLPIDFLNNKINMYNSKTTPSPNLSLDELYELSKQPNPPFKLELFGRSSGGIQKVIKTMNYTVNPTITFTLTINPVWGKTLPGVKINL